MAWVGTGVLWTVAGGVPRSLPIERAEAADLNGLLFAQISDSHIGFAKDANTDVPGTVQAGIDRIRALPKAPAFLLHTGDISHLSELGEFDLADQLIGASRLQVFYVPGEHDLLDGDGTAYRERYGKGSLGADWYSFDHGGVHFIALVNVADLKPGGMGRLGDEQLGWLEADLAGRSAETPVVVFAHIPLWAVYPAWGWGTEGAARALGYLRRFGSVTVLNGHIHQVMQKVEGNGTFHTAMSTAFPQPRPGEADSPGPMKVPAGQLRRLLGTMDVTFQSGGGTLAIIDRPLAGA
jgi:3',5'-cyclic AMP phosphodiesterase CpdA